MRLIVAACLLFAGAAQAQTPLTGTTGPLASAPPTASATPIGRGTEQVAPAISAARPRRAHRTLQERFDEANVTHDGHLTLERARSKMPAVARDFAAIDTDGKGYVTVEQIKDHSRAARAARRAAKKQTQ